MNKLIQWADRALQEQTPSDGISKILGSGNIINDSYNGAVAALGVSIAMGELLPALAIYYQDKLEGNAPKANRRSVLDVIARIITHDEEHPEWDFSQGVGNSYAERMYRYTVANNNEGLKHEVTECSIALKHVVRTYKLVHNEESA